MLRHDIERGWSDTVTKVLMNGKVLARFESKDKAFDWIDKNVYDYQGKSLVIANYTQELEPLGDGSYDVREEEVDEEWGYDVPFFCTKCGAELNTPDKEPGICGACAN